MTSLVAAVFSLLLVFHGAIAASCPDELGWIQAGNSCYLVSLDAMDWYSAQEVKILRPHCVPWKIFQFCWSKGSYLAEIQSREEEDLLDQFLVKGLVYWIGLDDLATEGKFVWAESHQVAEYTNWRASQPDNGSGVEDCTWKTVESSMNGWNDATCTRTIYEGIGGIHAICEYDL